MEIIKDALPQVHVRMVFAVRPNDAISQVIQRMNGRSSYRVQQEFPAIRKRYEGRHVSAKGDFSATSGKIADDVILRYLENHIDDPTDASRSSIRSLRQ